MKPCSSWIKKRGARPRQCPLLYIFFKRNNLCEKNMRKKYRSKKAWDKKSWNHSGSQQKVWHYLWFLLTFGKNSLIHYGRWIQQEGLVFNHQNTSATPFGHLGFIRQKRGKTGTSDNRSEVLIVSFRGDAPLLRLLFQKLFRQIRFQPPCTNATFRRWLWPWSSPGSLIFLVHGCGCGWLWPWCFPG